MDRKSINRKKGRENEKDGKKKQSISAKSGKVEIRGWEAAEKGNGINRERGKKTMEKEIKTKKKDKRRAVASFPPSF